MVEMLEQGLTKKEIQTRISITDCAISHIKRKHTKLPPLEKVIRLLEQGKTEDEVRARWGDELLVEALTWL